MSKLDASNLFDSPETPSMSVSEVLLGQCLLTIRNSLYLSSYAHTHLLVSFFAVCGEEMVQ